MNGAGPATGARRLTGDVAVAVERLRVSFSDGQGTGSLNALDDVSFEVRHGEFLGVVGPSGCGKSTLVSVLCGLLAHEGAVRIGGHLVRGPHPQVGLVMQEDSTFPWRTALRNVEFGLEVRGVLAAERRGRARALLELVGLRGFEDFHPSQLSGGMRQRVAIARTLILDPELLVMDEPFGALDEQTRVLLGEELMRIQRELGQTVVFVTHNIQEAVLLCDRILLLSARPGRVKAIVTVDLPRPRDSTLLATTAFAETVGRVWSVLREEALKTFAADVPTHPDGSER